MKPDGGLSPGDMDDLGMEPSKFFCQLGLLIIESRVPELSPRGRTEGPHCPADVGHLPCLKHDCDAHNSRCKRAEARQKQMNLLWCNKIPMCIEVLLFPDCQHGCEKANNTDVSMPDALTDSLLLEQWTIQVIPRRCVTRLVSPHVLFQAVKSYLYFSQLSAWLNTSHGTAPRTIAYRISPPGEFCTSTFSESPEWHEFPVCCLLKSVAVKISLAAVPRRPSVPKVLCSHPQHHSTTKSKQPQHHGTTEYKQPQHRSTTEHKQPQNSTERNIQPPTACALAAVARTRYEAVASCRDGILEGATAQTLLWPPTCPQMLTPQPSTGAIPKLCHYTPVLKEHAEDSQGRKDPARKVLYTKRSEVTQAYYPKVKSRTASPDIDYFASKTLESSTELAPLSPTDVQLYLLSLGAPGRDRADTRHSDDGDTHWPVGKQPPARTNLLRAFTDSVDGRPTHWHKFPSQKRLSPSLLQQQQQQQQQEQQVQQQQHVQQHQRVPEYNAAETDNVVSVKDYEKQTLHKGDARVCHKDDTQVCQRGDVQVCHKDDTRVCHKSDKQVCRKEDTQVRHKGDTQVCDKGDAHICHKNDPQVFHEGDPSARSNDETTSDNKDDKKELSSDATDGVTFSLGDNEGLAALNGSTCNTSLVRDASPSTAKGSTNGDTFVRRPCSTSSRRPFHKSVSMPTYNVAKFPGFSKVSCLLRSVIRKEGVTEASQVKSSAGDVVNGQAVTGAVPVSSGKPVPSQQDRNHFQKAVSLSSKLMFRCGVATPLQSSPAPIKKKTSGCFDFDSSLTSVRAIKNSISCVNLDKHGANTQDDSDDGTEHFYSVSAPASTNRLLGNFEESLLNGRIEPTGVVEGFTADIGASGDFCPKHIQADVTAFFFSLSDDNAPSPYLGHISLDCAGRRGYHVPRHGTVQVTLFNPNKTVVKMFVVMYNLSDMPANSQTFLRQRTLYTPVKDGPSDQPDAPSYLRYLIHLRFMSSRTGKIYLHTDIRLIFARDKFEYDSRVANYELRSFTEGPKNPEFSPKS